MAKSYDHNVQVFDDGLIISVTFASLGREMRVAIDCCNEEVTVYPMQNQPFQFTNGETINWQGEIV